MRKVFVCVSLAALLAGAGCNQTTGGGSGGGAQQGGASSEELAQISAQDLQAAAKDPDVRRFYQARGWSAVWTKDLAKDLQAAIADAPRHGLKSDSFLDDSNGGTPAEREVAMTRAALAYGHALAFGVVEPDKVFD